jgi:hypothetical protein
MSIVVGATTAVAAVVALVGLATPWPWPGLAGVMPARSSTLAAGPVVSGAPLVAAAFAVRRATPRKAR